MISFLQSINETEPNILFELLKQNLTAVHFRHKLFCLFKRFYACNVGSCGFSIGSLSTWGRRRRRRRQRTIVNTITARWNAPSWEPARSYNVKRPVLELTRLRGRNSKNFLGICSASSRNISSFFYSQNLKQRNKTLITRTKNKRANQEGDFFEPSLFAFPCSLLKIPNV